MFCSRHPDGGAVPNEYRQSWLLGTEIDNDGKCVHFIPNEDGRNEIAELLQYQHEQRMQG